MLKNYGSTGPPAQSSPCLWLYRDRLGMLRRYVDEGTMVVEAAVTEEVGQQGERVVRKDAVNEGFLAFKGGEGTTAWCVVFCEGGVRNVGEEFDDRPEAARASGVVPVQRLATLRRALHHRVCRG